MSKAETERLKEINKARIACGLKPIQTKAKNYHLEKKKKPIKEFYWKERPHVD